MKIVTVYREGGDYKPDHVDRLREQCHKYAPGVPFICMDNFRHNWPGWWAKMEVFRIPGPVLYMDLSNTVNNDLTPMLNISKKHGFVVNRDPNVHQRDVQSCVMSWAEDVSYLYELFAAHSREYIEEYTTPRWWGDQGFVEANAGYEFWQDLLPGSVASYKKHYLTGKIKDPIIINYHGRPKPWAC